jgi:hypothetical protein
MTPAAPPTMVVSVLLASILAASAASAQVPDRRIGVNWNDGVPHLDFSVRDLVNARVRRELNSGLPKNIVVRTYAYPAGGGRPIAMSARTCKVTYHLVHLVYRVEIRTPRTARTQSLRTFSEVLERCLVIRREPVGRAEDYRRGQRVFFSVQAEFEPLDPARVQRLRRWLARGSSNLQGQAFFGSFVSLFVSRRIGDAQHFRQFRSQADTVP